MKTILCLSWLRTLGCGVLLCAIAGYLPATFTPAQSDSAASNQSRNATAASDVSPQASGMHNQAVTAAEPINTNDGKASRFQGLGVNLAGAEFGISPTFSNQSPGVFNKNYIYPDKQTIEYFVSNGFRVLRIPFRWERIQPRLNAPLDADELKHLTETIDHARSCGGYVLLDLHNYGRYRIQRGGMPVDLTLSLQNASDGTGLTGHELADLWSRLAMRFRNHPSVAGYGLMNEPHDLGKNGLAAWQEASRMAVDAIRRHDAQTPILVAGYQWSHAHQFGEINGQQVWVNPAIANIIYEAHCYFDHDESGQYKTSFYQEQRNDPQLDERGVWRASDFINWCRRNNAQGYIGEYGVPDDPQWYPVLERFLQHNRDVKMGSCYWAAGSWWGDYPLSIQPKNNGLEPASQMKILLDYLPVTY